jgi:hypothetical protein
VLSRQHHFRDLLTGHGRRDGALRYAGADFADGERRIHSMVSAHFI